LAGEAKDRGGFADSWHAGDDHVRHVAVFCNDFEALDGLCVADDIVQIHWTILLDLVKSDLQRSGLTD
jgi:hypothetical protein